MNTIGFLLKEIGDKILSRYNIYSKGRPRLKTHIYLITNSVLKEQWSLFFLFFFFSITTIQQCTDQCTDDKHPLTRISTNLLQFEMYASKDFKSTANCSQMYTFNYLRATYRKEICYVIDKSSIFELCFNCMPIYTHDCILWYHLIWNAQQTNGFKDTGIVQRGKCKPSL